MSWKVALTERRLGYGVQLVGLLGLYLLVTALADGFFQPGQNVRIGMVIGKPLRRLSPAKAELRSTYNADSFHLMKMCRSVKGTWSSIDLMQSLHAGSLVLVAATMLLPLGTGGLWAQPADGTSSGVEIEDLSNPLLQSDHAAKVSLD